MFFVSFATCSGESLKVQHEKQSTKDKKGKYTILRLQENSFTRIFTKLLTKYRTQWKKFGFYEFLTECTVQSVHTVDHSLYTSGFWPRVRARALRAPVFLGSLTC
jgi:hypothetical protein